MIDLDTRNAVDLTGDEIRDLIATIQSTATVHLDENDTAVTTYESTSASEAAFDTLLTSFKRLIDKAVRASRVLDADDAEGVILMEFVAAIRKHDLNGPTPFLATISTILMRRMSDANSENDIVHVPQIVTARYWALVHKHGGSIEAAYKECRDGGYYLSGPTFLAVDRVMRGVDSFDASYGDDEDTLGTAKNARLEAALADRSPGPEESLVQADLVRWLFTKVAHRQEQILRLRYGFDDINTQNLRLAAGFRDDAESLVMSDREVAQTLVSSTQTVNRQRNAALAIMRDAMQSLVDEEAAA